MLGINSEYLKTTTYCPKIGMLQKKKTVAAPVSVVAIQLRNFVEINGLER